MGLRQRARRRIIFSAMAGVCLVSAGVAAQKSAARSGVSVKLPGAATAAMQTIDPEHIRG